MFFNTMAKKGDDALLSCCGLHFSRRGTVTHTGSGCRLEIESPFWNDPTP